MQSQQFHDLIDWLIDGARSEPEPVAMMTRTCERLVEAGLPLYRVGVFVETLHPDIYGYGFVWRDGQETVTSETTVDVEGLEEYQRSPLKLMYDSAAEVRFRLDEQASREFPFFDDMRGEGVTDYLALPLIFMDGTVNGVSFTTRRPGGFSGADLIALRRLNGPLARLIEVISLREIATTLLDTYVGNRAGARILAGQIRRGHADTMRTAIWLSDMRGFTSLSDQLPPEVMVKLLNAYFDCQVGPILRHGGEVLKFMGDGLLAVFPIAADGSDEADVCARMLAAAHECRDTVAAMNYIEGNHIIERFRFGVALHVGQVLYGNIGGGNRLDFTCIGPAVNLAARLERIAGRLGRTVVASSDFIGLCAEGFVELGEFPIRGLSHTERVYGLEVETLQAAEGL
ncbi:adenylate/guanylate cyclase domain-containing protein [Rhodopseudomonas palustris]|uniref:Adenylate/guanylate cyclase domain-containing protein n=1 Tax=Rhodopseudomonas palustris TaxID=1076 RepID=A0A418V3I2_RHOPL|nr:adenylate/guanylate cyclase domain-containing protein [Rhodopseudomonas palustris]RJF70643.1 adenylate/guanylate cyclase domain-containing protein [Rhodopseudomonas palustris]